MCLKVEKVASSQVSGCVSIYLSTEGTQEINFSHCLSSNTRSKSYLDPSPSQKFSPDITLCPSTISDPCFIICQISTTEIKHIMFNEAKMPQTIIGNPKLKWKNIRYMMTFYIIVMKNEQSLSLNLF